MKKRSLRILKNYKIKDYSKDFFEYVEHFKNSRIMLSVFIFIIYFSFAMDGNGTHSIYSSVNDLVLIGLFFSVIIYSSVFNFARALFCSKHKVFPLFYGELDFVNGFFKFNYLEWEEKGKSKASYYLTIVYDLFVFISIVSLIVVVSSILLK